MANSARSSTLASEADVVGPNVRGASIRLDSGAPNPGAGTPKALNVVLGLACLEVRSHLAIQRWRDGWSGNGGSRKAGSRSGVLFVKEEWAGRRRRTNPRGRQGFRDSNQGGGQFVYGILARDGVLDVIELKLARDFRDDVRWHRLDMLHVCIDQRMFTEQIRDARDARRRSVHSVHGLRRKDQPLAGASDLQTRSM